MPLYIHNTDTNLYYAYNSAIYEEKRILWTKYWFRAARYFGKDKIDNHLRILKRKGLNVISKEFSISDLKNISDEEWKQSEIQP
jgi:hypothetical protein